MPVSCVVGGCTRNKAKNPDIFWLTFPKDTSTRRAWVRFVNNTRSDFTLTSSSLICSAHFSDDCVDETVQMKRNLGFPYRFKLKVGSVPSIKAPTVPVKKQRPSPTTAGPVQPNEAGPSTSQAEGTISTVRVPPSVPEKTRTDPRKRSGGAYRKRERARVGIIFELVTINNNK